MDDAALRRQYDGLIERSGLTIPEDRVATMVGAYKQVLAWTDIVRTRKPGSAEPSNVFDYDTITRISGR